VLGKELGWYSGLTSMTSLLGYVALLTGDLREAESQFRTALSMAIRHELVVWSLYALAGLASVFARKGEAESAMALVAFVLHHPATIASARNRAEQLRPVLEAQLTPERVRAIELRAHSEALEEIVQELLAGSTDE
jgi:ATP/maltotriose-dependent transcriptional regulator MalT